MQNDKKDHGIQIIRIGMLIAAVLFIGIGWMRGEQTEVLQKAVRVCLECIGIG